MPGLEPSTLIKVIILIFHLIKDNIFYFLGNLIYIKILILKLKIKNETLESKYDKSKKFKIKILGLQNVWTPSQAPTQHLSAFTKIILQPSSSANSPSSISHHEHSR